MYKLYGAVGILLGLSIACQEATPELSRSEPPPRQDKPIPLHTEPSTAHTDKPTVAHRETPEVPQRDPFTFVPEPPCEPLWHEPAGLDLNAMTLAGIVTGTVTPTAMFIDKTGFGHILTEGTRVLKGRVSDIRDNEVEVTLSTAPEPGALLDDSPTLREASPSTKVIRLAQASMLDMR